MPEAMAYILTRSSSDRSGWNSLASLYGRGSNLICMTKRWNRGESPSFRCSPMAPMEEPLSIRKESEPTSSWSMKA